MLKREVSIKNMENMDWLAAQLPGKEIILEQLKHIEDVQIVEVDDSWLWSVRFRDLAKAEQVLEGLDVEFIIGTSRVEANICNLPKGYHRGGQVGNMMLEFPSEVSDASEVSAIRLVTFARDNEQVVKISLVYSA